MNKIVAGFQVREMRGNIIEIFGYSDGHVTEAWEVVTRVKVMKDARSGAILGYQTDGGKCFAELGDAITAQLIWKAAHPDIGKMIVGWVTYGSHPFIKMDYPCNYIGHREHGEKGKVNYKILPSPKSYLVSNDTPHMLLIIDKTNSLVYLVPAGERIEL